MDVTFFGAINPKRQSVLDAVRSSGVAVRVLTGDDVKFGSDLDEVLKKTKIVLNLHYYNGVMVLLLVLLCPHHRPAHLRREGSLDWNAWLGRHAIVVPCSTCVWVPGPAFTKCAELQMHSIVMPYEQSLPGKHLQGRRYTIGP